VRYIYIDKEDRITCSKLLKSFENELATYGFIRIHHNTLVNARYIQQVNNRKKEILLTNNIKLKVSDRKWIEFKKHFVELI
jgi:two-component system LytT family response regulator